jgi:predicted metallopeptidase
MFSRTAVVFIQEFPWSNISLETVILSDRVQSVFQLNLKIVGHNLKNVNDSFSTPFPVHNSRKIRRCVNKAYDSAVLLHKLT